MNDRWDNFEIDKYLSDTWVIFTAIALIVLAIMYIVYYYFKPDAFK